MALSNLPIAWLLGVLSVLLLGVATNLVYDLLKYQTVRIPRGLDRRRVLPTKAWRDVTRDGLYVFITWSRDRPLTEDRLVTRFVERLQRPHLFDRPLWRRRVAQLAARGEGGRTAYLVHLAVDHDEHPDAHQCRVDIAESSYAESLATFQLAGEVPELRNRLLTAARSGFDELLEVVPPTLLTASVAIISPRNRFLVLRRSLSVRTFRAEWTVGVNESMKYADEPGAEETFFSLSRRALREELGLEPDDYGRIVISWLGWSQQPACFICVATVRTTLSEEEVEVRRGMSHSVFEHDSAAWLPLNPRTVTKVITGDRCPDGSTRWIYLAPLVASEMWRCRLEA
jgi:hypothetical protein